MRFFDANCFLGQPFPPVLRSFATARELLLEMDDIGIEKAVVGHIDAQTPGLSGNRRLMNDIRNHERLLPCWIVHPQFFASPRDVKECLAELRGNGIRIVRVQPGPRNCFSLHAWAMGEFLNGLAQAGIILYVDMLIQPGFSPASVPEYEWPVLHNLAEQHPELNIILFGRKLSVSRMQTLGLLRACKNVILDISAFQTWRATELVCENAGADQLVLGSSMPYFDAAQFVVQIKYAMIKEEDKKKIAFDTLASRLGVSTKKTNLL